MYYKKNRFTDTKKNYVYVNNGELLIFYFTELHKITKERRFVVPIDQFENATS